MWVRGFDNQYILRTVFFLWTRNKNIHKSYETVKYTNISTYVHTIIVCTFLRCTAIVHWGMFCTHYLVDRHAMFCALSKSPACRLKDKVRLSPQLARIARCNFHSKIYPRKFQCKRFIVHLLSRFTPLFWQLSDTKSSVSTRFYDTTRAWFRGSPLGWSQFTPYSLRVLGEGYS